MTHIERLTGHLARILCFVAGLALLAMMVQVTVDAVLRYAFNSPLSGTIEIVSAYHMLIVVFFPLAQVTREGGHIVVTLFTRRLGPKSLDVLERCVNALTFAVLVLVIWMTTSEALFRMRERETWDAGNFLVEVWPSRWGIPIGCAAMALFLVVDSFSRRRGEAARQADEDHFDTRVG